MSSALQGRAVVVIGASSGIGRGVAIRSVKAGADVVMAARRGERLVEVIAEAGGGTSVTTDLRVSEDCRQLAAEVSSVLSSVDLVLISAGAAPLRRMAAVSSDDWQLVLETNVIGIHQVITELLPLLSPQAIIAVVSSEVVTAPRSHLGAYGASKAALEHSFLQWQEEHPSLRFTTVSLGATVPTEFGDGFATDDIIEALGEWAAAGRAQAAFMDTEEVCEVLVTTLGSLILNPTVGLPRIVMRSPAPTVSDADEAMRTAVASRES
jgi:NAD(P)-dependent dehydrogenase (short-subunit alcohol dehydrogenase family)